MACKAMWPYKLRRGLIQLPRSRLFISDSLNSSLSTGVYSSSVSCRLFSSARKKQRQFHTPQRPGPIKTRSLAPFRCLSRSSYAQNEAVPNFAFAFDIDGVLYRSGTPFPNAIKALKFLQRGNIPFILLTNGGGKHEIDRVKELSGKFGINLTVDNFVQSHTPFQEMAIGSDTYEPLSDKTILVTGADQDVVRTIANRYGFKKVVTPADILMNDPKIWPFNKIWTDYYEKIAQPLPVPINPSDPATSLKFDAVFVFNDPRDWALDIQIILDLLLSKNGVLGTLSDKNGDSSRPNNGWQQDNQPSLVFSNPDLFWASDYHLSRLGQGGFRAALEGVWSETTSGAPLTSTVIGKPHAKTYQYAERVLLKHRADLLGGLSKQSLPKLDRVFMVGDNPESDIRGANTFESPEGTEWTSILVKTGVWREGTTPKYAPKVVADDVLGGVKWALKQQGHAFVDEDFELFEK